MDSKDTQKEVLIWMLERVYRADEQKKHLENRLKRISMEMDAPIGGSGYDPLPRSQSPSTGAASFLLKMADIEERIYDQKVEIEKSVVSVMEILEFLPAASDERIILELRHIDRKGWSEIETAMHMSRSTCIRCRNSAIDKLLFYPKIQEMIREAHSSYIAWVVKHDKDLKKKPQKNKVGVSSPKSIFKKKKRKK